MSKYEKVMSPESFSGSQDFKKIIQRAIADRTLDPANAVVCLEGDDLGPDDYEWLLERSQEPVTIPIFPALRIADRDFCHQQSEQGLPSFFVKKNAGLISVNTTPAQDDTNTVRISFDEKTYEWVDATDPRLISYGDLRILSERLLAGFDLENYVTAIVAQINSRLAPAGCKITDINPILEAARGRNQLFSSRTSALVLPQNVVQVDFIKRLRVPV